MASRNDNAVSPTVGLGVVHLFCKPRPDWNRSRVLEAAEAAQREGVQVVGVALLGHKADLAFMTLSRDLRQLRSLQTEFQHAGLDVVDSYVSITEVSEYAAGMPERMLRPRLYPELPPEGKPAFCFYPMSKRRDTTGNWYTLHYVKREQLMREHGASGRRFAGRVVQIITGSTGLDDYEWGVSLFATTPDTLKEVVYTMRFDEASAVYAEFGPFYTGIVTPLDSLVHTL